MPKDAPQPPLSKQEIEKAENTQVSQSGQLSFNKLVQDVIIGVVIVLFIGFAASFIAVGGLLVNYEAENKAVFQGLKDQVAAQNAKIDTLTRQLEIQNQLNKKSLQISW